MRLNRGKLVTLSIPITNNNIKNSSHMKRVHILSNQNPLVGSILANIRDVDIQQNRAMFRQNLHRLGALFAYEISKSLPTTLKAIHTPLGVANCEVIAEQPVLATILRAGLPLHNGLLSMFDEADNAFVSAYRKHHKSGKFTIKLDYISCPDLQDRIVIISDPMLATGASMLVTLEQLYAQGTPKMVYIVSVIACAEGIEKVRRNYPDVCIWAAAIDEELTAKGYIVPGLGDAGDLAFGEKMQD